MKNTLELEMSKAYIQSYVTHRFTTNKEFLKINPKDKKWF
jgi:hypothetical protein